MGSPRRKKRTTGFWKYETPSFPPAAGSAPASGSAASGSGLIRMLLTWHDMMRRLGRFDEEFEEDYDEELHEELHEESDNLFDVRLWTHVPSSFGYSALPSLLGR